MSEVTLFSRNGCMQCKMTKRYLEEHQIPYVEHNINEEPDYIDYLKNKGFQSVPVLEAENVTFTGFRPDELKKLAI